MSVNSINQTTATAAAAAYTTADTAKKSTSSSSSTAESIGVIYEKGSSSTKKATYAKEDVVAKLKADADARTSQLRSLVEQMMTQQGTKIGQADDMWKFLAKGDFTVTAEVKAQAQADIAEDGYWGVEQTSDRIIEFAKALAGDDPENAEKMRAAFEKGFGQATKSWGKKLPDISQRTYEAVMKKFDDWAGKNTRTDTTTGTAADIAAEA